MDEFVLLILQIIGEFFFQCLVWIPFEFVRVRTWVLLFAGILGGFVSLLFHPHHIIADVMLRTYCLLITPFLFAGLVYWVERKMSWLKESASFHKFFDIYLFALTFGLIRFLLAR